MVQMVLSPVVGSSPPSMELRDPFLLASPRLRRMSENSCLELTLVSRVFLRLVMPNMACQFLRSMWYSCTRGSLISSPPRKLVMFLWKSSTRNWAMYSLGYFTSLWLTISSASSTRFIISLWAFQSCLLQLGSPRLYLQVGCRNFPSLCSRKQVRAATISSRSSSRILEMEARLRVEFCSLRELSKQPRRTSVLRVSLRKRQASFSRMYQEDISRRNLRQLSLSTMFSRKALNISTSLRQSRQPPSNSQSAIWMLISSQCISIPHLSIRLNISIRSYSRHRRRLVVCSQRVLSLRRQRMERMALQILLRESSLTSKPLQMILRVISSWQWQTESVRYFRKLVFMASLKAGKQPYPQHLKDSSTKGGFLVGMSQWISSSLKSLKVLEAKNWLPRSWDLFASIIQTLYQQQLSIEISKLQSCLSYLREVNDGEGCYGSGNWGRQASLCLD